MNLEELHDKCIDNIKFFGEIGVKKLIVSPKLFAAMLDSVVPQIKHFTIDKKSVGSFTTYIHGNEITIEVKKSLYPWTI